MSVLEAMASATPVMLSPGCHFQEVERFEAGIVVELELENWVKNLSSLLKNKARLELMGQNALNMVKLNYTWKSVVAQLENAYMAGIANHAI